MISTQYPPQPLSLPAIHAHWTAALSLPPTAQLSNLRRLVRAVTQGCHPALRPLSLAALCPLYLDLALAYAFLGEYYLASKVFKGAVDNDATSAVGWFGLGLAQAELAEWRNARRSWEHCLQCFKSVSGQQEGIPYVLFHAQDEFAQMMEVGLDSGVWTLERARVEFNFLVALREKGSKKLGVAPRAAGQKRPGLNGLSARLRFGPRWDASLQSLDSPILLKQSGLYAEEQGAKGAVSDSKFQPTVQTPPPSRGPDPHASLPPHISSHKPLPALPRSPPTQIPSLADDGSFNDHKPSLDKDPFTSSPQKAVFDPFVTSSQTLTTQPYNQYHGRLSQQPTLFTPEDQYFYDHSDDDDEDEEYYGPSSPIDGAIATSLRGLDLTQEDQTVGDQTQEEDDEDEDEEMEWDEEEETITIEPRSETLQDPSDFDTGEILLPRVFEGFGPPSQGR